MKETLNQVVEWVIQNSCPNKYHRYSRCIICDSTWWDDKETHNSGCWVPNLKELHRTTF